MSENGWRSGPVVAWTDREGPSRPPNGPSRLASGALAGSLGVVFLGVLGTDSLCPEHRMLVQAFATMAFVGIVVAIVGLLRGWALAPFTTLASALAGVAIGLIDAAHDPSRGRILALGFGLVAAGAAVVAARQLALIRWDLAVSAEVAPLPPADAPASPASPATPAAHPGPDSVETTSEVSSLQ